MEQSFWIFWVVSPKVKTCVVNAGIKHSSFQFTSCPIEYGYRDHALFYTKVMTSDPDDNTLAK